MKLTDVFEQLTTSELSKVFIGGSEAGAIEEANYPKVVNHINLALTAIYKRFFLKEGRITLTPIPGRLVYPIHSKYAVSNTKSREPVKYLQDTATERFIDDILKVESVQTDAGFEIPLNDALEPLSIATTSPTILRIPTALVMQSADLPDEFKTTNLTVVYRAKHPLIDAKAPVFFPDQIELELPESHLEALLLYVASRATTPGGLVNEFNAGNNYAAKYEMACQQLENGSFQINRNTSNNRLLRNGWV